MKNYKSFMTGWAFSLISFFPKGFWMSAFPRAPIHLWRILRTISYLTHKFSAVELDCFILFAPAALPRQDVT